MKKICYISEFLGLEKRGIESYSLGLLKNLYDLDNSFQFTLISGGKVQEKFIKYNYTFFLKPRIFKGIFGSNFINDRLSIFAISPTSFYLLLCSISIFPILIKNAYNFYIPTNFFEIIFCRVARFIKNEKSKIIYVGHAGPGHDDFKALKLNPDVFIALTKPAFDWAKKYANKKTKVELIPVGIDSEKFDPVRVIPEKNPFSNKNKIALFIGAFVPYKRPELTIRILEKCENINLLMVGQGPLLEELKVKYADLVTSGRLFFTGSVAHNLIPNYLALSDFLFMPSTNRENSPGVVLEAITMKKPVIATKYDRTAWMLGNSKLLVNFENPDGVVSAVDYCLKNYNRLSSEAYERSKYFAWSNVAKEWNKLFSL